MKQAHLLISGMVQGVWYRKFVEKNAKQFGLNGWVRNLGDNRVEAVFQGDKEKVEQMIKLCHDGPPLAEVKNVDIVWENPEEKFEEFMII